jgi:hypothetical protein
MCRNMQECESCRERNKQFNEGLLDAMRHMDHAGIAQDSIERGLVEVHLACNVNPVLRAVMFRTYPTNSALTN